MIDVHSHIIYGVDDGSRSLNETINILKEAENVGFSALIATPHFSLGLYEAKQEEIKKKIEIIQEEIKKRKINIDIYAGREIFINNNFKKIYTMAGSKYSLIELPMNSKIKNIGDYTQELKKIGIIPILAHPERYKFIQNNIQEIDFFIEQGWLIQCNYASIVGRYGIGAKETIQKLLKLEKVDFLGTDNHAEQTIYKKMPKILEKLRKIISEEQINIITEDNPRKIIKNEILIKFLGTHTEKK